MISNHLLNERNKLCKLPNKILNDKNFHLSIINNLAKDNYEKYFFMAASISLHSLFIIL